ncbi:MAG: hypothetical protein IIX44_03490 [Clostridia bacterium]|jgi:uncharacterized membrane protein|nr:hypothetical protein [Clostridia bacterium]
MSKNKKKREKVVWIDDGRTIADMSNLPTRGLGRSLSDARPKKEMSETEKQFYKAQPKWREYLATYFAAVRMMFLPMLAVIGIISIAFLILFVLSKLA